jgi:hypothetical protein
MLLKQKSRSTFICHDIIHKKMILRQLWRNKGFRVWHSALTCIQQNCCWRCKLSLETVNPPGEAIWEVCVRKFLCEIVTPARDVIWFSSLSSQERGKFPKPQINTVGMQFRSQ